MVRRAAAFLSPSPSASAWPSTPSASAKGSTICTLSMRKTSPAPSLASTAKMPQQPEPKPPMPQESAPASGAALAAKLAIELGPLLVFFGTNAAAGIYAATAVFMVATLIALGVAWWRYHKLPVMPLVSGAVVLVFGGLTLYLRDE